MVSTVVSPSSRFKLAQNLVKANKTIDPTNGRGAPALSILVSVGFLHPEKSLLAVKGQQVDAASAVSHVRVIRRNAQ